MSEKNKNKSAAAMAPLVRPQGRAKTAEAVARVIEKRFNARVSDRKPSASRRSSSRSAYLSAPVALASKEGKLAGKGSSMRPGASFTFVGHDFLTSVKTETKTSLGHVLFTQSISPLEFPNTRLKALAGLYQNWSLKNVLFTYEPACPTSTSGQFIGYVQRDPLSALTGDGISNIRTAGSASTERANSVWEPRVWSMKGDSSLTDLFCEAVNDDIRWASAGLFQLLASTDLEAGSFGTLSVTYEILFHTPLVDDLIFNAGAAVNTYDYTDESPFVNLDFTTSSREVVWTDNTITLPKGSWSLVGEFAGTGITACNWVRTSPDYAWTFVQFAVLSSDAKAASTDHVFYCDKPTTWQLNLTTTTRDYAYYVISRAPDVSSLAPLTRFYPKEAKLGKFALSRAIKLDSAPMDFKLPAFLIKEGVDWLSTHMPNGIIKEGTRAFARLVGWVLDSGLLGARDVSQVDPGLLGFWRSCGFRMPQPAVSPDLDTVLVPRAVPKVVRK